MSTIGKTNFPPGGTDTSDATAIEADILDTKTAYLADGAKHTGTMINKVGSATVITPSTSDQTIPQGYYGGASGDGKVSGDADLVAGNIKGGVNLFGVTGNYGLIGVPLPVGLKNNANSFQLYTSLLSLHNTMNIPTSICASTDLNYIYLYWNDGATNYIKKSIDKGTTFTTIVTSPGSSLLKCSANGQYIINATRISNDYGVSWTTIPSGVQAQDMSADGSIMYGNAGSTYYKSTNYGVSWSSTGRTTTGFATVLCSSDGTNVWFSKTSNDVYKSTDGMATDGSNIFNFTNAPIYLSISDDGSKYCAKTYGSSGAPESGLEYSSIFNNGNYIYSNVTKCCRYDSNAYWSKLFTVVSSANSPIANLKGTNTKIVMSANTIYLLYESL